MTASSAEPTLSRVPALGTNVQFLALLPWSEAKSDNPPYDIQCRLLSLHGQPIGRPGRMPFFLAPKRAFDRNRWIRDSGNLNVRARAPSSRLLVD